MVVGKDDGWQFWIVSDTGRVRQVTVAESSFAAAERLAKIHAGEGTSVSHVPIRADLLKWLKLLPGTLCEWYPIENRETPRPPSQKFDFK
jgi:hypothetical protein